MINKDRSIQSNEKRQRNCKSPLGCSNNLREARCTLLHPSNGQQDSLSLTQKHNTHTQKTAMMAGGKVKDFVYKSLLKKNPFICLKGTFIILKVTMQGFMPCILKSQKKLIKFFRTTHCFYGIDFNTSIKQASTFMIA